MVLQISADAGDDVPSRVQRAGRALVPLGAMFFLVGLSIAVVGPFVALFLSTAVHAGPVRVSTFLIAGPVAQVVSSTLIGRLSDRRPIRRKLMLIAALAGCTGSVVTAFVREYWVLLALAVTATAISGSLFPQAFAFAREVLERSGSSRAAMALSTLRMLFSTAWVAGPPVAAVLLELGGFRTLYLTAAVMFAVAALVVVFWLGKAGPSAAPAHRPAKSPLAEPGPATTSRRDVLRVAAALTMLQPVFGVQAMSLFMTRTLHAGVGNAGLVLGLCAGLEIPLMLAFGGLTTRWPLRTLIIVGAGLGTAYYALTSVATSSWQVAALQLLNASFISAVGGLGVSYMQELLPGQAGRASTLASNAMPVAAMLSGLLLGLSQHFSYRLAYAAGAVLCAAGLTLLLTTRPQASTGERLGSVAPVTVAPAGLEEARS